MSRLTLAVFFLLINLRCTPCSDPLIAIINPSQCHSLNFSFVKNRLPPPAASCAGAAQSRKVVINCAPTSGTLGLCKAVSANSNYYFVFVPNNNGGTFLDPTAGLIANCLDLWNAIGSANPPSNIYGAYYSGTTNGDSLACTDVGGCTSTSGGCISSWDPATQGPSSVTLNIPPSTQLLGCGFIDSPVAGNPPGGLPPIAGSGVPAIANSTSFFPITVTGHLNFNTWVDY